MAPPIQKRQRMLLVLSLVTIFILGGVLIYENLFGFGGPRTSGTAAPTLETNARQQVVYRIDTAQSAVQYTIEEQFAGQTVSTAIGTTRQVAGDILVDQEDFSQSVVGTIVINIEQFESNSGLRDRRIRREYLESSTYPEAVFVPREIAGIPPETVEGVPYTFEIVGDLSIKTATHPSTWMVTATLDGDTLTGSASTTILMSDYEIGPINIAGFVETANEVRLDFEFVATAQASE